MLGGEGEGESGRFVLSGGVCEGNFGRSLGRGRTTKGGNMLLYGRFCPLESSNHR